MTTTTTTTPASQRTVTPELLRVWRRALRLTIDVDLGRERVTGYLEAARRQTIVPFTDFRLHLTEARPGFCIDTHHRGSARRLRIRLCLSGRLRSIASALRAGDQLDLKVHVRRIGGVLHETVELMVWRLGAATPKNRLMQFTLATQTYREDDKPAIMYDAWVTGIDWQNEHLPYLWTCFGNRWFTHNETIVAK